MKSPRRRAGKCRQTADFCTAPGSDARLPPSCSTRTAPLPPTTLDDCQGQGDCRPPGAHCTYRHLCYGLP
ncbi:hypothetical protein BC828DRAFT_384471 [Blastocladiella britannica]|nr:hypothetical protein BC828DRAFT_384471 [Blastocladiella britannica]